MKELIKKLVELTGPSGHEDKVREFIRTEIAAFADEIRMDALGNLIVRKGQAGKNGKTLMMSAHMDEIGVIVTHIDENGFCRFSTVGGVRPQTCLGGRVKFVNGTQGVIGSERFTDMSKAPSFDMLFIDVGATDRNSCPVKVGDMAGFDRPFIDLGNRLVSKAMDDRIACLVLIEGIKRIKTSPNTLYFVFTTQEEVGLRGAITSAYGINPDFGLAVDVTTSADTPKAPKMNVALGKGPAIKVRDESIVVNPAMIDWMVKAAQKINIPYQYEVLLGGGTDAGAINLTHAGAPSICLSIPTRYIHSPSEMVDLSDIENSVKLLVELASNPI